MERMREHKENWIVEIWLNCFHLNHDFASPKLVNKKQI